MSTTLELVKQELPTIEAILRLNSRPNTDVSTIAQQELLYLEQIAQTNKAVYECEPFSVVMAVKSVMKQNLTLDPAAGLVYVKSRNVNVAPQGQQAQWKKVLEIMPSANGLISIARQCGRILDYKNPQIIKDSDGKNIGGSMEILKPSPGQPRWETYSFDESDIQRWRMASHKENSRNKADANATTLNYANPLYTSWKGGIDTEFLRSKLIRHSLKKLGTNPNEQAAVRIYDVPKERVVDPEIDMHANEEITYIEHESLPNADEL